MPTLSNLTIADGASTPVNHTFEAHANDGGLTEWRERSGPVAAQPRLTYLFQEKRQAGYTKTSQNLMVPNAVSVTDPVTGAPVMKVLNTNMVKIETMFGFEMTKQQKIDALVLSLNAAKHAILYGSVTDGATITG